VSIQSHQHLQQIPSTVWTIDHGLYCNPIVSVSVYEEGALVGIIPADIEFVSNTSVIVTFTSPRTGEARLS